MVILSRRVNKWRETYRLSNASISLDTVDELGTFVEIEVMTENDESNPTQEIENLAKEIGAEGVPLLASYLELLIAKRSAVQP